MFQSSRKGTSDGTECSCRETVNVIDINPFHSYTAKLKVSRHHWRSFL